jgi:hypothetical protein
MVKNILTLALFFILIDTTINVFTSLILANGFMAMISLVIRPICFFPMFCVLAAVINYVFRKSLDIYLLIAILLAIFISIPIIVYCLMGRNDSIFNLYTDMYSSSILFKAFLLPYLISSTIFIVVARKYLL